MTEEAIVMLENILIYSTLVLYLAATVSYFIYVSLQKESVGKAASVFAMLGLIIHTGAILSRVFISGRAPFINQFEFSNSFAWGVVLAYVAVERLYKHRFRAIGTFVMPVGFIILGYALILDRTVRPLMPALQSAWLPVHVFSAVLGYGAFAVAAAVSVMWILKNKAVSAGQKRGFVLERLPDLNTLDEINYKSVAFGFLFLTFCIITGSIWAESAWGRYWGWDPKETWSLITWFVYAVYLHTRITSGWEGRRSAWFAIVGFICVLFTFLGVNILLPGLHSYF